MTPNDCVLVGWSDKAETLLLNRANRHGVVAGATGTGKTVTLQILAQGFSDMGVPVFAADVKGDLSGIALPGDRLERFAERAAAMGLELKPAAPPVMFWDVFGKQGQPIRATVSEMGPLLLARMLGFNDVQAGVLNIVFHVADQEGLLLLDLKDLQAAVKYVGDNAATIGTQYGNVAPATIGAIQRALLSLQTQGAESFFGEPTLQLADLMRTDLSGRGYVNILAANQLIESPALYSTFLLWLMSELFEQLPEVGDPDKPRLVFFFDEAHLLFRDATKPLLEKIEQVVRLIRSKGVGIYFVTQNPADIPDSVLAQLGNRIQHALRAYTPADQKGLRAAAQSFRANPQFDTAEAIQGLGVGEALVSTLDAKGAPNVVQKTMIRPPVSRLGPATAQERSDTLTKSPVKGLYEREIDRESAFEILQARTAKQNAAKQAEADAKAQTKAQAQADAQARRDAPRPSNRQSMTEAFTKSLVRAAASSAGRQLIRGVLGSLLKR
ncbi:MAG TPA: helicase HerA-like domain-containing protein [Rhizomicrobium sp.]|nr:helicase HerA-like domain-containing protein [Rhizomicrobium sp.]